MRCFTFKLRLINCDHAFAIAALHNNDDDNDNNDDNC